MGQGKRDVSDLRQTLFAEFEMTCALANSFSSYLVLSRALIRTLLGWACGHKVSLSELLPAEEQ